jgi:hypothetical protein
LQIFFIPAQAGVVVQGCTVYGPEDGIKEYRYHLVIWVPACAGMTVVLGLSKCHSDLTSLILISSTSQTNPKQHKHKVFPIAHQLPFFHNLSLQNNVCHLGLPLQLNLDQQNHSVCNWQ